MKKKIYIICSLLLGSGIIWLFSDESNTPIEAIESAQEDFKQISHIDKPNDMSHAESPYNDYISYGENYRVIHQPTWDEKPIDKPMSVEEREQYIEQKNRAEKNIKEIMHMFADNLGNKEKRIQLESDLQVHKKEYKQAMLKLGNEIMERKSNR